MKPMKLCLAAITAGFLAGGVAVAQAQPGGISVSNSHSESGWITVANHKKHRRYRQELLPYQQFPGDHYSMSSRSPRGAYEYSRDPDPWMRGQLLMEYNKAGDMMGNGSR